MNLHSDTQGTSKVVICHQFSLLDYKFYAMSNDHSSIFSKGHSKIFTFPQLYSRTGEKKGKKTGLCLKNQVHPPNPIGFLPKCHNSHWVFSGDSCFGAPTKTARRPGDMVGGVWM